MSGLITQQELCTVLSKKIDDSDSNSKLSKQQIGVLTSLKTSKKDSLVNAINELYNNTVNGKKLIADAIRQKGINVGDGVPSYQQLYDWIMSLNNYIPPDLEIIKTINTLDDWTEHSPDPDKPEDTNGYIDIYIDSILSARINIGQWNERRNHDWYLEAVRFFNNKIKRITINGVLPGYYDNSPTQNITKIIVTNKITYDYYQIKYFRNSSLMHISIPTENNYGDPIYTNEANEKFRKLGRKVMRGFSIIID